MACYDRFGQVWDGRPFWVGAFTQAAATEIVFFHPSDGNWWLGRFDAAGTLTWTFSGNTAVFGNLADGRPFWTGQFTGTGRDELVFYHPSDHNWWLGRFDAAGTLTWNLAGNTVGFGQVADGRPFWTGQFTGTGWDELVFYHPSDHNWWLGRFDAAGTLTWNLAGNTAGFGQVGDGRPFWTGHFTGTASTQLVFYHPSDHNWWLGHFDAAGTLTWNPNPSGNTAGFGQVWDGRPFWTGRFTGTAATQLVFYHPSDHNWWLGRFDPAGTLTWNLAGNTIGFGQVADGRPFWTGRFTGTAATQLVFYHPSDHNWWLGRFDPAGTLAWNPNPSGNTAGFGQVGDGRPFWTGQFTGTASTQLVFYHPSDGNWWLGRFDPAGTLTWNLGGNTGHAHHSRVRMHLKIVSDPTVFTIDQMVQGMTEVYDSVGIMVEVGSTERIPVADPDFDVALDPVALAALLTHRNNVGPNDVVVYLVRTVTDAGDVVNGANQPSGSSNCLIASIATQWTMGHEVGHALGLGHVNNNDQLMTGNGTINITNPPPDLMENERLTMENSPMTQDC